VRFVDADDFDGLRAAINEKTRAVYTETLGNPKLDIADIEKLAHCPRKQAAAGHRQHLGLAGAGAADRVGADIVLNSATKFLGGHGTAIGGIIVDAGKFDWAPQAASRTSPSPILPTTASPTPRLSDR